MKSALIGLSALALLGLASGSIAQNNLHGIVSQKLLLSTAKPPIKLITDDESTTNSDQDQSSNNDNGNQDTDSNQDQNKDQSTDQQSSDQSNQQGGDDSNQQSNDGDMD